MKRLALFVLLLLSPLATWGACTGSSPNWTATPDFASVQTCYNNATRNTDTVTVSAGSATWSSTLTVTKGVSLVASGTVTLTIGSNIPFITATPDATAIANSENITVSGFTFNGNNVGTIMMELDGASGISGTKPYRYYIIKNNFFKNQGPGTSDGVITASSANNNGQLRGVISGNDFDRCDIIMRVFSNNDSREWANTNFNNFVFGTEDSLYFETNNIHYSSSYSGANPGWMEIGQGGRVVVRYNTYNQTNATTPQEIWDIHGFQDWNGSVNSGQTGSMLVEYYGNTLTNMGTFRWVNMRSTWGLFFDNILTGSGGNDVDLYGASPGIASCPSQINPVPITYNSLINNTYFFNNTQGGTNTLAEPFGGGSGKPSGCTVTENNSASVGSLGSTSQGGWWNQNASCTTSTCAAGIGQGTTAPSGSCTKGVGFWVASTPTATASSSVIQAGTLYKCTATNTWTAYYTPFTYPHPLLGAPSVANPTFSPVAGTYTSTQTVTIATTTSGATLCYTIDGSTPTTNGAGTCTHGTTYAGTVSVAVSETIKAIGTKSGVADSSVVSAAYVITAAAPTFSPVAGAYSTTQTVTIATTTGGATICYTTDGTTPTTNGGGTCTHGTTYSGTVSVSTSQTIQAIATLSGIVDSSISSAHYSFPVATPTFAPGASTYTSTQSVTISDATGGATICYTQDGSTPTANGAGTCTHGTTYSSPVTVSTTQTLKAIGSLSGSTDSAVGSAAYVINLVSKPAPAAIFAGILRMNGILVFN